MNERSPFTNDTTLLCAVKMDTFQGNSFSPSPDAKSDILCFPRCGLQCANLMPTDRLPVETAMDSVSLN
jgi:hypothetical protein